MSDSILLTGCAGFIGARVSEMLLERGATVVGIDNLNDAYDVRLKHWRLERLLRRPGFTFHRIDITDRKALALAWEDHAARPFDAVINLAARAGVRQSVENPTVYFETNVNGTLNLLELCVRHGVRKFVLASSSSVYGNSDRQPFREDAPTDMPQSPYAASKKAAEVLCYAYHKLHHVDTTVLRFFTVYGPAGRPDMSLFRFVQWIAEGRPVIVFGNGTQQRDFTFVDDIARGVIAASRPLGYQVVNLGGDRPVRLNSTIATIEKLLHKPATFEYRPAQLADVPATWADVAKARELLGWQPLVSIEDGLMALVNWYLANQLWTREIVTGEGERVAARAGAERGVRVATQGAVGGRLLI